jgi:hypothetical protein
LYYSLVQRQYNRSSVRWKKYNLTFGCSTVIWWQVALSMSSKNLEWIFFSLAKFSAAGTKQLWNQYSNNSCVIQAFLLDRQKTGNWSLSNFLIERGLTELYIIIGLIIQLPDILLHIWSVRQFFWNFESIYSSLIFKNTVCSKKNAKLVNLRKLIFESAKIFTTLHMTITNISIGIGFIYVFSLIELFRFLFFHVQKKTQKYFKWIKIQKESKKWELFCLFKNFNIIYIFIFFILDIDKQYIINFFPYKKSIKMSKTGLFRILYRT